ncbi:glycoside hydrolase family 5 protein [Flagellimonas sp. 2504JD4-2]
MKSVRKITVLILLVLLNSCSKDDSINPTDIKSNEANLLKLDLEHEGRTYTTSISGTNITLSGALPYSTVEVSIKTLAISDKATANRSTGDNLQVSDGPISIEVTAEDGTKKSFSLNLEVASVSNSANLLGLELESNGTVYTTVINGTDITLSNYLPNNTIEVVVKTIEFSSFATSNISKGQVLQISQSPISFEITAQDGMTQKTYLLNLQTQNCLQLPFGVNLAGAEFGNNFPGTYNTDYTYPTVEELDYFNSKGLKLMRLPFRWERVQPVLGGDLNSEELGRIENFLQLAKNRNMFVILDLHNYGRYNINGTDHIIGSANVTTGHIKDLWSKLSSALADRDEIWGYGIMNEPHDMLSSTPWFNIAQNIITGIRDHDINTRIIVGGDSWSSAERWMTRSDTLKDLKDPSNNLVFEAHVYFDNDASGKYDSSYDGEGANPNIGVDRVKPFIEWLRTNKLKGFIGEYGVPSNDDRWLAALDNFLEYLKQNCVNGTYWAAGPWWGDYILSIEPENGMDKPQMAIVEKHVTTN